MIPGMHEMFGVFVLLFCALTCFLQFTLDIFTFSIPSAREFVRRNRLYQRTDPPKGVLVCRAFRQRP